MFEFRHGRREKVAGPTLAEYAAHLAYLRADGAMGWTAAQDRALVLAIIEGQSGFDAAALACGRPVAECRQRWGVMYPPVVRRLDAQELLLTTARGWA